MAGEFLLVSQFAAAALMLLLALFLVVVDFSRATNRVFAVFLLFRSVTIVLNRGANLTTDAATDDLLLRLVPYFLYGTIFALAYFLAVFPRRRKFWGETGGLAVILLSGALLWGAYLYDHCLATCTLASGARTAGPLFLVSAGYPLAYGLAAWWLAREFSQLPQGSPKDALRLVFLGFLVNTIVDASLFAASIARAGTLDTNAFAPSVWSRGGQALAAVGLVPGFIAAITVARERSERRATVWAVTIALTVGVAAAFSSSAFALGLLGFSRMALPLLVAVALLRYGLFDLDVRLKATISRTTVGAVFVAVFFVVSEMAAQLFSNELGTYIGIVVAGFLVFMIAPLQASIERLSQRMLPHAMPIAERPLGNREKLYRDQAALAWHDGALDLAERAMLERLRIAIGLSHEEARRLEEAALRDTQVSAT